MPTGGWGAAMRMPKSGPDSSPRVNRKMSGADAETSIGPASVVARNPAAVPLDRAEAGERRDRGPVSAKRVVH